MTQTKQKIYRVHDTMAETTTVVMAENKHILVRNYRLSYNEKALREIQDVIEIELIGIIDNRGQITVSKEPKTHTLHYLLEEYDNKLTEMLNNATIQ